MSKLRMRPISDMLRRDMRAIYIAHAFSNSVESNTESVRRIGKAIALAGNMPLAPHLLFGPILDDHENRDLAMSMCLRLVALADEIHVYGERTEGMRLEIAEAVCLGIPVIRKEMP